MRGGGGYNQGSFVHLPKACGGWVFACINGVGSKNNVLEGVGVGGLSTGGGGSEEWLQARVLCGCEAG